MGIASAPAALPLFRTETHLYMTASFRAPEPGFEHQKTMPTAVGPEGLPSETEIAQSLAHLLPPILKESFSDRPLEIRPVEFHNPLKGHVAAPVRQVWIRANGTVRMTFASINIYWDMPLT